MHTCYHRDNQATQS